MRRFLNRAQTLVKGVCAAVRFTVKAVKHNHDLEVIAAAATITSGLVVAGFVHPVITIGIPLAMAGLIVVDCVCYAVDLSRPYIEKGREVVGIVSGLIGMAGMFKGI